MNAFPEIAFGTYEEFILGYIPEIVDKKGKIRLKQTFATHSHQASMRCVASHGQHLVSSGADEYINIYNMLRKEIVTAINFHNSTVTCLEFVPDGSHLISANQNGDIAIFNSQDWRLVKHWKEAHKTSIGVTSISVHPCGGLLMSVGSDNILRFWNLIKGRQAYAVNLAKKCSLGNTLNFAKWSKTGNYYIVCIGKLAEIYGTESASVVYKVECPSRISSLDFSVSEILLLGLENGIVQIHNLKKKEMVHEKQCHKTRVKCLLTFLGPNQINEEKALNYVLTADSAGVIKLWRLRIKKPVYSLLLKSETDVECRITCLTPIQNEMKEEPKYLKNM